MSSGSHSPPMRVGLLGRHLQGVEAARDLGARLVSVVLPTSVTSVRAKSSRAAATPARSASSASRRRHAGQRASTGAASCAAASASSISEAPARATRAAGWPEKASRTTSSPPDAAARARPATYSGWSSTATHAPGKLATERGMLAPADHGAMPEPRDDPQDVSLRIVPQGAAERAFDNAFWQTLGPDARLLVLWDMVLEREAWTGAGQEPPRLKRSIIHIERIAVS